MYEINFLFVLYSYINRSKSNKKKFKADAKETFRKNFAEYLADTYMFYSLKLKDDCDKTLLSAIRECFYDIKGKVFMPYVGEDLLIMALNETEYQQDSKDTKAAISRYFNYNKIKISDLHG